MLRLSVCVVCEKVVFSQEHVASLINLFTKIGIALPAGAPEIPPNAVTPKEWAVFSSWDTEPGDELKEYLLCTQVLYPDNSPFGEVSKIKMNIERNNRSQVATQVAGFPIGQIGFYTIKVWVEENQRTAVEPIELRVELEIVKQKQP